jgi:hypothetical protein
MAESDHLPVFHVVGFTGHRQVADPAGVGRAITGVLDELQANRQVGWLGISSIADGCDMLFARAVLDHGMGWEAVLPLTPAEFRQDFEPATWTKVEGLLAEAELVRVIGERTHRNDAYLDCGMETANHCDVLLAVWDGQPARGRGGTAEIVAYAREMGRPVILIDPATLAVRRERLDRLKLGDRHLARLNRLPPVLRDGAAPELDPGMRLVRTFQHKVDLAATRGAPHFRGLITLTVGLHVLATGLAAAALAFELHSAVLPWGKLACLIGALGVALVIRHRRESHDWVRARLAAEIARSALATWGLPRGGRMFEDMDWSGIEPLRRSLDILQRRASRARPMAFDEFKQRYIHERIDGQLAYFARNEKRAGPVLARFRAAFLFSTIVAIACSAAYAVHNLVPGATAPAWLADWVFDLLPIVLPVLAAGFVSLISINDLHRRVARYSEMRMRLESARKEAVFSQTWGSLERVVTKVERALLQEVFEWHTVTSFSESH